MAKNTQSCKWNEWPWCGQHFQIRRHQNKAIFDTTPLVIKVRNLIRYNGMVLLFNNDFVLIIIVFTVWKTDNDIISLESILEKFTLHVFLLITRSVKNILKKTFWTSQLPKIQRGFGGCAQNLNNLIYISRHFHSLRVLMYFPARQQNHC